MWAKASDSVAAMFQDDATVEIAALRELAGEPEQAEKLRCAVASVRDQEDRVRSTQDGAMLAGIAEPPPGQLVERQWYHGRNGVGWRQLASGSRCGGDGGMRRPREPAVGRDDCRKTAALLNDRTQSLHRRGSVTARINRVRAERAFRTMAQARLPWISSS